MGAMMDAVKKSPVSRGDVMNAMASTEASVLALICVLEQNGIDVSNWATFKIREQAKLEQEIQRKLDEVEREWRESDPKQCEAFELMLKIFGKGKNE